MASREDVYTAVQWEREKVRGAMIYWKDKQGNLHPVPILQFTDGGDRWCIEIPPNLQHGEQHD